MAGEGKVPKSNGHKKQTDVGAAGAGSKEKPICFIIMPISDPDGYAPGHFSRVYEDIFKPACEDAGFDAVRADEVSQTNLIMLDVLRKLVEVPMVLCDLSSRNPNVLFELGLRQAFDKPVVLVQEQGAARLFDIASLRDVPYSRDMSYRQVLEDRTRIAKALKATQKASGEGDVNSLVRLLALTQPATLPEVKEAEKDPVLQLVRAEISELRADLVTGRRNVAPPASTQPLGGDGSINDLIRAGFERELRKIFEGLRRLEKEVEQGKSGKNSLDLRNKWRVLDDRMGNLWSKAIEAGLNPNLMPTFDQAIDLLVRIESKTADSIS
jgi:hypothetical protein